MYTLAFEETLRAGEKVRDSGESDNYKVSLIVIKH